MSDLRTWGAVAGILVFLVGNTARSQSKTSPTARRVQALLHVVRAETPDTTLAWMLVDSMKLRSVARLSKREFDSFAHGLGPRAQLIDTSAARCPEQNEVRCLGIRFEALVYERSSWFVRLTRWNAKPGGCGFTVRLYRVGFVEGSPITLADEDAEWGHCGPPRRSPPIDHLAEITELLVHDGMPLRFPTPPKNETYAYPPSLE